MTFELRIPPPIVMLATGALMWALAQLAPGLSVRVPGRLALAASLAVLGVAVAIAGVVAFHRARTTVNPLKPQESSALVVSGIYARTRNPMYVGMALVVTAWAVFLGNPLTLLGVAVFIAWIDRFQIEPEERALRSLFGPAFGAYRERVRRWL
jgi:protein-S-isoprenylcysteine O-methyltransferase Ste14